MITRVQAGLNAKLDGHITEELLAKTLGSNFKTLNGTQKTDIYQVDGDRRISLKNSTSPHTQVALISQSTFCSFISADKKSEKFVKLFFGFADNCQINQEKLIPYDIIIDSLDHDKEIRRNRLLFRSIPNDLSKSFINKLNHETSNGLLMNKLVAGDANIIAWVAQKNSVNKIIYASMKEVLNVLRGGSWTVATSGSVLDLKRNNKKLMYIQMKGSSARFSPGYHSCMIHLYRAVMDEVATTTNLFDLKY